jgi:histidinol phosphatase-like PHP family hydrolase
MTFHERLRVPVYESVDIYHLGLMRTFFAERKEAADLIEELTAALEDAVQTIETYMDGGLYPAKAYAALARARGEKP